MEDPAAVNMSQRPVIDRQSDQLPEFGGGGVGIAAQIGVDTGDVHSGGVFKSPAGFDGEILKIVEGTVSDARHGCHGFPVFEYGVAFHFSRLEEMYIFRQGDCR